MNEIIYLIYLLAFIIGSIVGLLFSYKQHGEPFIYNKIDVLVLIIAILSWIILINSDILSSILSPIITISIGLFFTTFVLGMRPGYGRYETVIGIIISIAIYGVKPFLL
ncbi:MAG: DUF2104 domain-containing protein [Methanobrevibacter sp.]|jgi:energy-converting hydrogenase A subunit L|nr:DUF2104 domain-containing protein [Candidatus Methanovirga meridionalis]